MSGKQQDRQVEMLEAPSHDLLQAISLLRGRYIGDTEKTAAGGRAVARLLLSQTGVNRELALALAQGFNPQLARTWDSKRGGLCVLAVQREVPGCPPAGPFEQVYKDAQKLQLDCELGAAVAMVLENSSVRNGKVKAAIAEVADAWEVGIQRVKEGRSIYELRKAHSQIIHCLLQRKVAATR